MMLSMEHYLKIRTMHPQVAEPILLVCRMIG